MSSHQIIIAGDMFFNTPAERDAALASTAELQRKSREEEPGCLAYTFGADPADPARVQIYELWEDEASLAAHFLHDNYYNMGKLLGTFDTRAGVILKYRTDYSEAVYDDTGVANASFFTLS